MKDIRLRNLFQKLNITIDEVDELYFSDAVSFKPIINEEKEKAYLTIELKQILPIRLLKEIHDKFKFNDQMKIKLNLNVEIQDIDANLLADYISFIKKDKAQFKGGAWHFVENKELNFDSLSKTLFFDVSSYSLKTELTTQLEYLISKLNQYGIKDIKFDINVNEISEETIKEQEEAYRKKVNEQFASSNQPTQEQPKNNNTNKYFKWNNRGSLDKPDYEKLIDIENEAQNVVIHGYVYNKQVRESKTGRKIYSLIISDDSSSIAATYFGKNEGVTPFDDLTDDELNVSDEDKKILYANKINIGDWIALKGKFTFSTFDNEYIFYVDTFEKIQKEIKLLRDNSKEKRVELHVHSKMSVMDGISTAADYIKLADQFGWKSIALTDHLNVQAYPDAYDALKKINKNKSEEEKINLIYGLEAVMLSDHIWYSKNNKNNPLRSSKLIFFDLETTGLSPELDEIIEFGAVIYDGKTGERKTVDILIKPEKPLKQFTKELTNISDEMLENQPTIKEAIPQILELIKDGILVAHNATFDFNFLSNAAEKNGYEKLDNTIIDTLSISRVIMPGLKNHRLGTVAKKMGIFYDENIAHRGDYDADILSDVYDRLLLRARENYEINVDSDWNIINPINPKDNLNLTRSRGYHVNILAKNQEGLKDIYKIISESHTNNFLGSPKIYIDKLWEFKKNNNILIGAGCINSEIFEMGRTNLDSELERVIKQYDFIEIQPLSVYKNLFQNNSLEEDEFKVIVKKIIKIAKANNVIIVATSDAHYTFENLKLIREILINSKGLGGSAHPLYDFKHRVTDYPDQHVRTTKQMLDEMEWLEDDKLVYEIVITNSNLIADQIEKDIRPIKDGLFTPKIENVDKLLMDKCYETANGLYGNDLPLIVKERLEKELESIIKHGFAVVYWISHLLVNESYEAGYLVGSRGSVGSSFVATMSKITEVNPLRAHYRCEQCKYSDFDTPNEIKCGYDLPKKECPKCNNILIGDGHDIPFETFLGFDGDKVPDIDLNFSGEYQGTAHNFTKEMFGEDNVFRAGTISTVANKTAFGYTKAYYEEQPIEKRPRKVEIERQANLIEGVKRTTGQHPGGIVILPSEFIIEDFTPVNYPADDDTSSWKTTHFDFHSIHDNLLKMDILGHVDPTALKMLRDLTGVDPLSIPVNDEKVYSLFSGLEALNITAEKINGEITGAIGIPEFGTSFVRSMLKETKPKTFADLVQISGLSHGTDVWLGNARELINKGIANISTVIGCRDDIMVYLVSMNINSTTAFDIMESVRKGKGLKREWIEIMKEHNVPDWYIESCLKIKYMFPKAHATAYVLMAYRVAWYKIYYPAEYYATFLTTRIDVFDLKTVLQGYDACLAKLKDIQYRKANKLEISKKEEDLEVVFETFIEMFSRGIKFSNVNFEKSEGLKFIVEKQSDGSSLIIPPFNVIDSLGEAVAQSIINARTHKPITSVSDLKARTQVTQTQIQIFSKFNILDSLSDDQQLKFEF